MSATSRDLAAAKAELLCHAKQVVSLATADGSELAGVVLLVRRRDGTVGQLQVDPSRVCLDLLEQGVLPPKRAS